MAATFAIIGSLVLIFSLADMIGRLRTPETREQVAEMLSEPPGSGLGLEVAQVVDAMRVLVYVAAALAAAVFVLAIYVLQRHRGARVGLTVAAALLLFTTPVAGVMPILVGVAAVMLWSAPARDWFAGRAPAPLPARRSEPWSPPDDRGRHDGPAGMPSLPPVVPPPAEPTTTDAPAAEQQQPPPAERPFASAEGPGTADAGPGDEAGQEAPATADAEAGWQHHPQAWPAYPPARAARRPWTVTLAAVLTWLGSAAVSTGMLAFLAVLAFDSDTFVDEFDRAAEGTGVELGRNEVLADGWAVGAILMLWALTAAVLAVMAFRRSQAGRIGLVVSSAATALLSLLAILSIVPVVTLLMAGATIVLLFTGGANDWYAGKDSSPRHRDDQRGWGGPAGGPGGPGGYPAPPPYAPPPPKEKVKPW